MARALFLPAFDNSTFCLKVKSDTLALLGWTWRIWAHSWSFKVIMSWHVACQPLYPAQSKLGHFVWGYFQVQFFVRELQVPYDCYL